MISEKVHKLISLLGLSSFDGAVPLAALSGMFTLENAPTNAVLFLAGPAAIITATLLGGPVKERMIAASVAGVIATILIVFAAGLGPKLLEVMNVSVLKIIGGIAVIAIGLLIMGVNIPAKVPTIIMMLGVIASIIIPS